MLWCYSFFQLDFQIVWGANYKSKLIPVWWILRELRIILKAERFRGQIFGDPGKCEWLMCSEFCGSVINNIRCPTVHDGVGKMRPCCLFPLLCWFDAQTKALFIFVGVILVAEVSGIVALISILRWVYTFDAIGRHLSTPIIMYPGLSYLWVL